MSKKENKEIPENLQELLKFLSEKKVTDVTYLNVEEFTPFASYYVLATCHNTRFLATMADDVENFFDERGIEITGKDGIPDSGWMIVQGEDIAIHLFLDVNRKEINLEGFVNELAKKTAKIYVRNEN